MIYSTRPRHDKFLVGKNTLDLQYIPLTKEMVALAEKHEKQFRENKGIQNMLTEDCDLIGSLAQQAVVKQFELWHFKADNSKIFDPNITSDKYDFIWRYEKCDVKGSSLGKDWHDVFKNTRFLIESEKELSHRVKGLQRYVFVKIDLQDRMAIIAGTISFEDFWRKSYDAEEYDMRVKKPTRFILASQLTSFDKWSHAI